MKSEVKALLPDIDWSNGPREITCDLVRDADHKSLLSLHDGLTAFKGGLRIFGTTRGILPTLREWNKKDGWRSAYKDLISATLLFFAEDVFGNQFALDGSKVVYFNAEVGRATLFERSFSEWLSTIIQDPINTLQLGLFREWAAKGEQLSPSEHLCPVYPFIVKSDQALKKLYRVDGAEDMSYKGNFAFQVKGVAEGSQIKIKVID